MDSSNEFLLFFYMLQLNKIFINSWNYLIEKNYI